MRLGPNYFKLFFASAVSNIGDGIGAVAYPWLASALTRNPLLIAFVAVVQRLPWLVFSLPAGAITDRHDRKKLMVGANAARAILTAGVAVAVYSLGTDLASPDQLDDPGLVIDTNTALYLAVLAAALLLGFAEVLYDNTAQTFMPSVVEPEQLEKANGRLWSVEEVTNTFGGPVLGALLLSVSFALPFGIDAITFAVSAALIAWIRPKSRQGTASPVDVMQEDATQEAAEPTSMRAEVAEGFRWLWKHELLRPLALILGLLNMIGALTFSTLVLFAQEVLETSPTEFALLNTGGAVGGIVGGWTASWVSKKLGSGPSLWMTLVLGGATSIVNGLTSEWLVVWAMFGIFMFGAVVWNVITVSLRQAIIPDELLGRVNSVYRFFAWGSMPLGALIGGVMIALAEGPLGRETALRLPFLVAGVANFALLVVAAPRLTSARIDGARAEAEAKA